MADAKDSELNLFEVPKLIKELSPKQQLIFGILRHV